MDGWMTSTLCSIELGSIQCINRKLNLHISKIWFLFSVSFTIEYKVGIAEFYPYMGFGAVLSKNVLTRAWKLPKSESAHLQNQQTASGLSHKQASMRPNSWAVCKIWWKSVKNCGRVANCELRLIKTKSGIRTPLESDFYFRFHSPLNTKSAIGIAEFYLYMGFGADLLKNMVTRAWKLPKSESAHF